MSTKEGEGSKRDRDGGHPREGGQSAPGAVEKGSMCLSGTAIRHTELIKG